MWLLQNLKWCMRAAFVVCVPFPLASAGLGISREKEGLECVYDFFTICVSQNTEAPLLCRKPGSLPRGTKDIQCHR